MKKTTFLFTMAATAVLLAASPSAKAISPMLSLVTPADTFSFDILGYNTASGSGYFVAQGVPTFGVTSTYTGIDGQVVTVSSSETVGVTNTTDTFTVSTPASFITDTTLNGLTITGLELDLGNANSGAANGLAAGNTVDTVLPITTYTGSGTTLYSTSTTTKLTPGTTLSNSGMSYAAVEGIQAGTSAINQFNVRQFTYTIVYPNVPEPSTWAMCGLGLVGGAVMIRRRRLAA